MLLRQRVPAEHPKRAKEGKRCFANTVAPGVRVKHLDSTCLITKLLIHNSLPLKQLTASCLHIKQFAVTSSAFRLFTCERLSLRPFN